MPDEVWQVAEAADAIFLGAMGLPDVRYDDGTEITPQLDLRFRFDLFRTDEAGKRQLAITYTSPVMIRKREA